MSSYQKISSRLNRPQNGILSNVLLAERKISAKFWGTYAFPTCFRFFFNLSSIEVCEGPTPMPPFDANALDPNVVVPQPQDTHLDAVQHIAEEQDEQQDVRPTVLDMFAGAGGTGLGFYRAGFQIVGVVEWNAHAALTYSKNLGVEVKPQDIQKLDPHAYRESLGLAPGQLDVLVGCSPCQGFSEMRNDGGAGDERNGLVLIYLHFIEEFRPRFVLFENVAGIRERHGRAIYEQFCNGLRQLDYAVTEKLHDAADFGVPQHRERVLVVAGRDLEEPPFPTLTHAAPHSEEVQNGAKERWQTVRDAIGQMPPLAANESGEQLQQEDGAILHFPNHIAPATGDVVLDFLRRVPRNGGSRRDVPFERWLNCHRRIMANGEVYQGHNDVYGRLSWDRPSGTLTTGCTNPSKGRFSHPEQDRALTPREAAALQGFPMDFVFHGKCWATQIGNAVPPPLAEAIARALVERMQVCALPLEPTRLVDLRQEAERLPPVVVEPPPNNTDIFDVVGTPHIEDDEERTPNERNLTPAPVLELDGQETNMEAVTREAVIPLLGASSADRCNGPESAECSHRQARRALRTRKRKLPSRCKDLIPALAGVVVACWVCVLGVRS